MRSAARGDRDENDDSAQLARARAQAPPPLAAALASTTTAVHSHTPTPRTRASLAFTAPLVAKSPAANASLGAAQHAALALAAGARTLKSGEWVQVLAAAPVFSRPTSRQQALDLELATLRVCADMSANNTATHNFSTLLLFLLSELRRQREAGYEEDVPSEAFNTLFLVRVFVKYFVDNLASRRISEHFAAWQPESCTTNESEQTTTIPLGKFRLSVGNSVLKDPRPRGEILVDELIQAVISLRTSSHMNYEFYMESLNLLIVLFSTQLRKTGNTATSDNYFLDILFEKCGKYSSHLIMRLLINFLEQQPPVVASTGLIYSAYSYFFAGSSSGNTGDGSPNAPGGSAIANKSILLILVLANQRRAHGDELAPEQQDDEEDGANSFRAAIASLQDSQVSGSHLDVASIDENGRKISFKHLYLTVCNKMACEETLLLLYLLMLQNRWFRSFVLSRTDPEGLMIPLLRLIYEAVDSSASNYSQLYIMLIIVLLLSQDEVYCESIQKVTITQQNWFTERMVKSISLGGLTILVLIRVIQANLVKHKDIYFHTNCLASLANMSTKIINMHPFVAQRLIGLFEVVSKRYTKLQRKHSPGLTSIDTAQPLAGSTASLDSVGSDSNNADPTTKLSREESDLVVYADLVALILEIVNAVVTHTLRHNPQMVYALLHRREMFEAFRVHPRFGDLIENIEAVITYFNARILERTAAAGGAPEAVTTDDVLAMINKISQVQGAVKLKLFSELQFVYEEDKEFSLFFLPYVWSLVYRHALIYWSEENAELLNDVNPNLGIDFNVPM